MKTMKKILAFMLVLCMVAVLTPTTVFAAEDETVDVATAEQLIEVMKKSVNLEYHDLTINITDDIDLTGKEWTEGMVNGYNGAGVFVVNGNNHTITGLTAPLFSGTWAAHASGLTIKDLTIANSNIEKDVDDAKGSIGVGAFVGYPSSSGAGIHLDNCHLVNSTVSGGHWTGGLIGTSQGYSGNDGPVFMEVTINNCSVVDSTIEGKGSVGAIIGHGALDAWTKVTITDCTVTGNTVTSNDDSDKKAGSIVGTIGAAGSEKTVNGETHTGGIFVDAIVKNNTVTSNGTSINRIFGRIGSTGGRLVVTDGKYYDCTRANCVAPEGDAAGTITLSETAYFKNEIHSVTVTNGTADKTADLLKGDVVTITATVAENTTFEKWEVVKGNVTLEDATKTTTTFVITDSDVEVKAVLSCVHSYVDGVCKFCKDKVEAVTPVVEKEAVETATKEVETVVKDIVAGKETDAVDEKTAEAIKNVPQGNEIVTEVVAEVVTEEEVKKEAAADVKAIDETVGEDGEVAQYLDLSVVIKSIAPDGEVNTLGTLNKLSKPIPITLVIPEDLQVAGRTFYVIRVHDGKVDKLPLTKNADGSYTFTTDRFSTYALAYEDGAPNTGDNSAVMMYVVMAVAAMAVVVVLKKRNTYTK